MQWLKDLLGLVARDEAPTNRVTVRKEAGSLFVCRISGVLNKAAVDQMQALSVREIEKGIKDIRMLLILSDFKGWRKGDAWGDLDFFMTYGNLISKIAVVGDTRWQEPVRCFLLAGQRRGEVRYFPPEQEAGARAWLGAAGETGS